MKKTTNNTHVLIVGVDEYDNFPQAGLKGCRNDAISWWRLCVGHLGVPPSQVTVLASPELTIEELCGAGDIADADATTLGSADAKTIQAQFKVIAERLVEDSSAAGLFTFSGHGVILPGSDATVPGANLSLCPKDATGNPSDHTTHLLLTDLEAALLDQKNGQRLEPRMTMVLDACYTGGGRHLHGPNGMPGADQHWGQLDRELGVVARLLMASQEWTAAYEFQIEGQWHGAFSWATTRLLERWSRKRTQPASDEGAAVNYLNVSYHDLLHHVTNALAIFSQKRQAPVIWGLRRFDRAAFLHVGPMCDPRMISPTPDRIEDGRQIPVGPDELVIYSVRNGSILVMLVIVAGVAGRTPLAPFRPLFAGSISDITIQQGEEYWLPGDPTIVNMDISSATALTFRTEFSGSFPSSGASTPTIDAATSLLQHGPSLIGATTPSLEGWTAPPEALSDSERYFGGGTAPNQLGLVFTQINPGGSGASDNQVTQISLCVPSTAVTSSKQIFNDTTFEDSISLGTTTYDPTGKTTYNVVLGGIG